MVDGGQEGKKWLVLGDDQVGGHGFSDDSGDVMKVQMHRCCPIDTQCVCTSLS